MRIRSLFAAVGMVAFALLSLGRVPTATAAVVPVDSFTNAPLRQSPFTDGWEGYRTYTADVNGDGRDDLIWNRVGGPDNRTYVAFVGASGALTYQSLQDHPLGAWRYATTTVGDVNGDHRADLIWTTVESSVSRVFVGLAKADGQFTFLPAQERGAGAWEDYTQTAGDVNGDGRVDLIWNKTFEAENRTYVAVARGDGTFKFLKYQDESPIAWDGYELHVGDVNGDGRDDLVWSRFADTADVSLWVAFGGKEGTLVFADPQSYSPDVGPHDPDYEQTYTSLLSDMNGDGIQDLVWAGQYYEVASGSRKPRGAGDLIIAYGDRSGEFEPPKRYDAQLGGPNERFVHSGAQAADVNGDGRAEMITTVWDDYGETEVYVTLFTDAGELVTLPFESGPRIDTRSTSFTMGDATGDGRPDLIWNKRFGPVNRLYIGRGNANSTFTWLPVQDHP